MSTYFVISIIVYFTCSSFITIYVGKLCFKHGKQYLLEELQDESLSYKINQLLLLGYYLLNLGYVTIMISQWPSISDRYTMIGFVASKIGRIVITLGCMHYVNMLSIYLYKKFNHQKKISNHGNKFSSASV